MKETDLNGKIGGVVGFYEKPTISKIKVFSVDDETRYLDHVKSGLEETGEFEVTTCQSPAVALIQIQNAPPDFLILDINMPHIDGGDFLCRMQNNPSLRDIPTLMVSSLISPSEMSENGVVENGGQAMMAKPADIEKLKAYIKSQLACCLA